MSKRRYERTRFKSYYYYTIKDRAYSLKSCDADTNDTDFPNQYIWNEINAT